MTTALVSVPSTGLFVAPCARAAATYATRRWHYSRTMPAGRLFCVGVWESGTFIGALVFGRGASSEIGSPFGLRQDQICELCRIALAQHETPVSRILSITIKLLRKQSPNLKAVVSYADPQHSHTGRGVYAASGWAFIGTTNAESLIRLNGRLFHPRSVTSRYRTRAIDWLRQHVAPDAAHVRTPPKFRYITVFDDELRRQLVARVRPYPRRAGEAEKRCGRDLLPAEDRAIRIPPLHHHDETAHG